jgi:di/tricarboxylate transporter
MLKGSREANLLLESLTTEMWIALLILAVAIVLFVTEWIRLDVVALGVVVALVVTGILTTPEALAGFSSTTVILIAALFVVGGAIFQTGIAASLGNRIMTYSGTSETRLLALIMIVVALLSGIISSTGVVAVMLPAILTIAARAQIRASRLMIPMAIGALFGGALTLIGTPPNIIVTDLLTAEAAKGTLIQGQPITPFAFFSFTPLGLLLLAIGVVFMIVFGRRLLPDRKPLFEEQQASTPAELLNAYKLPDNLFRLRVRSKSPLIGRTIEDSRLGQDHDLHIIQVLRVPDQHRIKLGTQALVIQKAEPNHVLSPEPTFELRRDDVLIVQGDGGNAGRAAAAWNLAIQPSEETDRAALLSHEVGIAEVVLPPRSSLIGKNLVELSFGTTYRLTVLRLDRPDSKGPLDLKTTALRFGDTLVVQGEWKDIFMLKHRRRDFIVMGETSHILGIQSRPKAPLAMVALAGMVLLMIFGASIGIDNVTASLLAVLFLVLARVISMNEAYDSLDMKSLILIAGMIPMATALQKTGLVDLIVSAFSNALAAIPEASVGIVGLAGIFVLTAVLTQVLSNTATTVLLAPIAFGLALELGLQPYAFLMAVAVAASMAFATPVASPVNTLVMGPGNYRFRDYLVIGLPLLGVITVAAIIILPILFPLV